MKRFASFHGFWRPYSLGGFYSDLLIFSLAGSFDKALAYSGGYALEFDGDDDLVILGTLENILGSTWKLSKTLSVWVRPLGSPFRNRRPKSSFRKPHHWGFSSVVWYYPR